MSSFVTLGEALEPDGDIKTGPFGTVLKAAEYRPTGVPLLSVGEIRSGFIEVTPRTPRVGHAVIDRLPQYLLCEGDVAFARKGGIERTAYVGRREHGWFLGSDGLRARPGSRLNGRFLAFQLGTPRVQAWLKSHATGSTMPSLSEAILARVPIWLPPVPIQQAIAEVLGALDDKIAANRNVAHSARILGQAAFERATKNCALVPLDEVSHPLLGGTPSRAVDHYWNGNIPWVSVRDISAAVEESIFSTDESITQHGSANSRAKVVPAGSVILSARGTVGSVARLAVPAAFNQSCYAFAPDPVPASILYYSVRLAARTANLVAHGSVFSTITMNTLSTLLVPRVDNTLGSALDARLAPLLQLMDAALRESQTLATLRDTLLPALMDGALRVKDAITQAEEVL